MTGPQRWPRALPLCRGTTEPARIRPGRWRLRLTPGPVRVLLLTQTPDPSCRYCDGEGGWLAWWRDTRYVTCVCWDPLRASVLLRLRHP